MIIRNYQITRTQLIIFGAIAVIIIILGLVFFGVIGRAPAPQRATLEFWGVYDDSSAWRAITDEYRKTHPEIFVNYTEINPDTYEKDLLEALASGNAPDIIMFHSSWLPKHGNKVVPIPQTLMTIRQFQETFPDVATTNFVANNQIYALPVWIDALAMLYNKDLFNTAGIAVPPKTWDDFIRVVQKLSNKDKFGNLTKSGAAIGAANNVNNVADILSLLMLQTGAKMISDDGTSAAFERQIQTGGVVWNPGESALRFYTDFANPKSAAYTWNDGQTNSLDAFAGGKTAIIFDYAVTIPQIKERAPGLRLGTAAMPQLEGASKSVNYADYWGYAVPAASRYPNEAWQFIFYASGRDINKYFSTAVGRLASRRDVIAEEQTDPNLGVFAEEILSAVSWYQADPAEIEAIFKEMINAVILKNTSPADAIADAASKVTFLMRK